MGKEQHASMRLDEEVQQVLEAEPGCAIQQQLRVLTLPGPLLKVHQLNKVVLWDAPGAAKHGTQ